MLRRPTPDTPGVDQESVWSFPRPPIVVPSPRRVVVEFAGRIIADSRACLRVLETSHPPSFYLPRRDVDASVLDEVPDHHTVCEYKGEATYGDLVADGWRSPLASWWYPDPAPGFEALRDHVTFYPSRVDRCLVDGEEVRASEGDFYGGWITSHVTGPFKGRPGTQWW